MTSRTATKPLVAIVNRLRQEEHCSRPQKRWRPESHANVQTITNKATNTPQSCWPHYTSPRARNARWTPESDEHNFSIGRQRQDFGQIKYTKNWQHAISWPDKQQTRTAQNAEMQGLSGLTRQACTAVPRTRHPDCSNAVLQHRNHCTATINYSVAFQVA